MGWPCPTCGRELSTERGMRQHHTKVHGEPLPNRTCTGCETEFYDPKARRTYCDGCNPNAGEHNGNWKGGKETAICQSCGEVFHYYSSDKKGMFCSARVARSDGFLGDPSWIVHEPERVQRTCEHRGREMSSSRPKSTVDGADSAVTPVSVAGCRGTGLGRTTADGPK